MSAGAQSAPAGRSRDEAIARLRERLIGLSDGDQSICRIAADRGIFCRGFRRWHDREFHERWKATLGVSTHLTRAQMEQLADLWQLAEQVRHGVAIACDAPPSGQAACRRWEEFSNSDIQALYCEMIEGEGIP